MTIHILVLLGSLAVMPCILGILVNRTIDDTFGDQTTGAQVLYLGKWDHVNNSASAWQNGTFSQGVTTVDDPNNLATLSFNFTGIALYIFGIVPGQALWTNSSLLINGQAVQSFQNQSNSLSDPIVTNVSIYSVDSLPYGTYNVTIQTLSSTSHVELFQFDYAVYTTNTSTSDIPLTSNPSSPPAPQKNSHEVAIIAASVCGSSVVLVLLLLGLLLRWRSRRKINSPVTPTPASLPISSAMASVGGNLSETLANTTYEQHIVEDGASAVLLRQQLQFFRAELQALRMRSQRQRSVRKGLRGDNSLAQIDSVARQIDSTLERTPVEAPSSLAQGIYQLRAEIAEMRAQNQNIPVPTQVLGPASDDVQRELGLLRDEIEELRAQQLDDPVPEYSSQAP